MNSEEKQLKLVDIPLTQVRFSEVDYLYEAGVAFSRKRGDRTFFIKEPERLARTTEELMVKYKRHHSYISSVLDERDRLLSGKPELEAIMELIVLSEGETQFLSELISLRREAEEGTDKTPWPSAVELAKQLIEAWHMFLVAYNDLEADIDSGGGVEAIIAKYRELLAATDFSDFSTIVQLIMASENEGDVKIKLIEIHQRESEIFAEMASLLLSLAILIKEQSEELRPDMEAVAALTRDEASWKRCRQRVAETVSVDLGKDVTIYLSPQLMVPNALGMSYTQEKKVFLSVGIYFFELIEQVDVVRKRFDTIIEQTKLLSDPSRLRIIMLLQNRPMYLKELADNLGLSSATISHHVQNMINHDLLQITMTSNNRRIYYGLRYDRFTELGRLISALGEERT